MEYKTLPEDHICVNCDDDEPGIHTENGLCLACGGCWDPECCGGHDEWCMFKARSATM